MENSFIKKWRKMILFSVFALAAFLIIFGYTTTPVLWVDEGLWIEVSRNLAMHGTLGLQTDPGVFLSMRTFLLSVSYPVILPVAMSIKFFGLGVWQARLPMIIYMFILVVLFYLFTKKRYGKKYGLYPSLLSLMLLLSFSPFYGNGRSVLGEVPGLVFFLLGSLLLLYLQENDFRSKKLALITGLAFGLAASTKTIFLLGISASLAVVLVVFFRKIPNKKTILFIFLGYLLPVLIWFYIHFPTLHSVASIIPLYLYFSGNHGVAMSGSSTFLKNFLRFFTESTPILFLGLLGTTIFSFSFNYFKKKNWDICFAEIVLLLFIVLNWIGYMRGTGWYRYFFPANILIYLFFPAAVIAFSETLHKPILKKVVLALPIVLMFLQFYHLVFLSDTSYVVKRERNTELERVLSVIPSSKKVLFYNTVEAAVFLKGTNYSQYIALEEFLVAGNKDAILHPDEDYILMGRPPENPNFSIVCYDRELVSRYFLFKKINNCK